MEKAKIELHFILFGNRLNSSYQRHLLQFQITFQYNSWPIHQTLAYERNQQASNLQYKKGKCDFSWANLFQGQAWHCTFVHAFLLADILIFLIRIFVLCVALRLCPILPLLLSPQAMRPPRLNVCPQITWPSVAGLEPLLISTFSQTTN